MRVWRARIARTCSRCWMRSARSWAGCTATWRPTTRGWSSCSRRRARCGSGGRAGHSGIDSVLFAQKAPLLSIDRSVLRKTHGIVVAGVSRIIQGVIATVRPAKKLEGAITVPGDKSISHRALMFGSIASGESRVRGLSTGADVQSTASCMRSLGVVIEDLRIEGRGRRGGLGRRAACHCRDNRAAPAGRHLDPRGLQLGGVLAGGRRSCREVAGPPARCRRQPDAHSVCRHAGLGRFSDQTLAPALRGGRTRRGPGGLLRRPGPADPDGRPPGGGDAGRAAGARRGGDTAARHERHLWRGRASREGVRPARRDGAGLDGDGGRHRGPAGRLDHQRTPLSRGGTRGLARRPPRGDGARDRRPDRRRKHRDRRRRVRGDLVSGLLRPPRISVLKVRCEIDVDVVAFELYELEVTPPRDDFELEIKRSAQAVRSADAGQVKRSRELFRKFRMDPTRMRPSSEALLRRMQKGEALPRINSLVDVANALSVQLQVPVGLYDLEKVKGEELVIRLGNEGESYEGIGKERVNVAGRICVADADGPIGNPSADSARTMITTDTERAAWIYFLPVREDDVDRTAELIAVFGRGLMRMAGD